MVGAIWLIRWLLLIVVRRADKILDREENHYTNLLHQFEAMKADRDSYQEKWINLVQENAMLQSRVVQLESLTTAQSSE